MKLGKFSFGVGDRFNHEGEAQLRALIKANSMGVEVTPVWNKSNREHNIVHSEPAGTRQEADAAVKNQGWHGPYFVDADHINLTNVDRFIQHSDFFTLDVAMYIGNESQTDEIKAFKNSCFELGEKVFIPGIPEPILISNDLLDEVAGKFLAAVKEAGKIYRHIESVKGKGNFVTEVSMDEVESPQTPVDMFFILKMIADEKIPAQTIAPKFTGRFNKGVDYVGDAEQFAKEFEQDVLVIDYAVKHFGLPEDLKLSVHSGSDKFTIYPIMAEIIKKHNKGLHVKTAGTTWLEELIGLAHAGGEGLKIAQQVYRQALARYDELCGPYATVIDIDKNKLPSPDEVDKWSCEQFADALRHDLSCPQYNLHFRQLLHVGYKIAAEMGPQYIDALEQHEAAIAPHVTENLFARHIKPVFSG